MNGKSFLVMCGAISLLYVWRNSSGCASKSVSVKCCHASMRRRVIAQNAHNYYGGCFIVLQITDYFCHFCFQWQHKNVCIKYGVKRTLLAIFLM